VTGTPDELISLVDRVLSGLMDRSEAVNDRDRDALIAYAENESERSLPLRLLAVLVLDRARQAGK